MLYLSHGRLPTRWRLALATARRRGACATRATFSTTAATAFSIHPTTTRLQSQTSAAPSQSLSPVSGSCRSFSRTARWQNLDKAAYEGIKASKEGEPAKVEEPWKYAPDKPKKPDRSDLIERLGRKPIPGPKLAAMKRQEKAAKDKHATVKEPKVPVSGPAEEGEPAKAATDEDLGSFLFDSTQPLMRPSDVERIEKAVLAEIEAQKAKKATKQADKKKPAIKKPDMIPFGPFEDVIQPLALTLWGGKVEENQKAPKLRYTMQFLGPTCFWRVQIRSTRPKSDNDLWKILWKGTRPGSAPPTEEEKAAWVRDKGESQRRYQKARVRRVPSQEGQEIDDKESDGPEQEDDPTGKVPPLKAVVQDVYKRDLAQIAYEMTAEQRESEARNRQWEKVMGEEEKEEEGEVEEPPHLLPVSYGYKDPHMERPPFFKRTSMRHVDICGPAPPYVREQLDRKGYFWTVMGGNVIANTFEMERVYSTAMHDGVQVWVWRAEYDMREMQAFMFPGRRARLERIKEEEKNIRNRVLGRKGPPPKSDFVRRNDTERQHQLKRKSHVLRQMDGGWKKILEVVQHEKRDEGFKLPRYGQDGVIIFTPETPHPDRATMDAVWGPRLAALRDADAIADYDAFLRRRMKAGILPAKTTPNDFIEGQVLRGWVTSVKRNKPHPGDIAKQERKAAELAPMNFASLPNDGSWQRREQSRRENSELPRRERAFDTAKGEVWKREE